MIKVNNLKKIFGPYTAVDDISFEVKKGEVLGFLGPNGAGKSTTMKMITGFLSPTSGSVEVCGENVEEKPLSVKHSIGYLPEGSPAYGDMTPLGFLNFIAEIRGYKGEEKTARVQKSLESANLQSVVHKSIETLSKGFKRRVGLAQAILHDPPVLIMDEPTDGLDPNQKHEVRELIKQMAHDKAIIISTHILEEVDAICSRAIIIARGKLLFDGTPHELQARSGFYNAVRMTFADDAPAAIQDKLQSLPQVDRVEKKVYADGKSSYIVVPKDRAPIISLLSEQARKENWMLDEFYVDSGHLDEVFRTITTQ